jgi:chemotaxis protein methyltransferase CheR
MNQQAVNPVLSEHELEELRLLIEQHSGIVFDESRQRFFVSRLAEHLRDSGLGSGTELLRQIRNSNLAYDNMLERLLTQETRFLRYPALFHAFEHQVLPELQKSKFWDREHTLKIWSAGCASGEEPYSIALCVAEAAGRKAGLDASIMATDISREALERAERGVYPRRSLENLTPEQTNSYFTEGEDGFAVKPALRSMIRFAPMNLAQPVYLGRFECIFCMNVLIYFGTELRNKLIRRFYDTLEPGGYLFLGHAESAANAPVNFVKSFSNGARLMQKPLSASATGGSQ